MSKKKKGQHKADSINAVNSFFGEDSFEDTEDAPKPPRMTMVPYVCVPLLAPKKVDHMKDWKNTGSVLKTYFKKPKEDEPMKLQTPTRNDDDD